MGFDAKSPAACRAWAGKLRAKLRQITGYETMSPAPARPRITESVACDGYVRQRIVIQTEPGIDMPLYALVPEARRRGQRLPAVLCPHGHGSGGKASPAGRRDLGPRFAKAIDQFNYDYGVQFARAGFIAFCPDARGFGERLEPSVAARNPDDPLVSSCQFINQMALPLGQTVTGMWAFDLHALARYVQTRPDCDPDRIACAGLSGGGLQTLWATALDADHLIKAAVVSGYFYGYRESLLVLHQNCSCNFVPHMYELADMGDLGALIAPRPLLIETGDQDTLNGASNVENVKPQVAIARRAYRVLKADKLLVHDVFPGGHRWHGAVSVPWLKARMGA
jgi:dienelactone hydrolase